ncbi:hypothetical protein SD457_09070 [Coprobacillaceae bacterium CR2/5/TPMF4]|nr:hypothetical protein SD457_09070 [Coprobacillaceae bacterium CR2/5/TPMF4]
MIAAGFILVIGIALLGSKFYIDHYKKINKIHKTVKDVNNKTNSKFVDFFSRKKSRKSILSRRNF